MRDARFSIPSCTNHFFSFLALIFGACRSLLRSEHDFSSTDLCTLSLHVIPWYCSFYCDQSILLFIFLIFSSYFVFVSLIPYRRWKNSSYRTQRFVTVQGMHLPFSECRNLIFSSHLLQFLLFITVSFISVDIIFSVSFFLYRNYIYLIKDLHWLLFCLNAQNFHF